jgi:hypothetical protein
MISLSAVAETSRSVQGMVVYEVAPNPRTGKDQDKVTFPQCKLH